MDPTTILTAIIATVIVASVIGIIVWEAYKKKKGKGSCSCGGSCGSCGMDCHCKK